MVDTSADNPREQRLPSTRGRRHRGMARSDTVRVQLNLVVLALTLP